MSQISAKDIQSINQQAVKKDLRPADAMHGIDKINYMLERGPSRRDILNFTNQLAVMIKAGISLQDALESIGSQIENRKFRDMLLDIRNQIESGQNFSQALARYPSVFNNLYVNMVSAAEISGSLSSMLNKLADYLDQETETRSQVISAMVYPIILAVMAIGSTSFLLMFVLPRFIKVFAGKEHLLPLPTKMVMGISFVLCKFWFIILPVILGGCWLFHLYINTKEGRKSWDKVKLKIPLMRSVCRNLYISRGLHTMGVLNNSGVPILDTLNITADISGNVHYRKMWQDVHEAVKQGRKIASSLSESKLLPGSVIQMINSGEDSGNLGEVLKEVSAFYARELKAVIKIVTSMLEPIMIVVMGSVVGFIASSIILPIFKMSSIMAH